jgi:hypothetical protein
MPSRLTLPVPSSGSRSPSAPSPSRIPVPGSRSARADESALPAAVAEVRNCYPLL